MKRFGPFLLKLGVSVGLLFYLFSLVDLARMTALFAHARLSALSGAWLVMLLGLVVSAYKWQALLRVDGIGCSILELTRYYLVGIYFNNFLPTSIGGDASRAYLVARRHHSTLPAVTSIFAERFSGLLALLAVGVVGLLLTEGLVARNERLVILVLAGSVVLGGSVLLVEGVWRRFFCFLSEGIRTKVSRFFQSLKSYCADPKALWALAWTSLIYPFLVVLVYFFGAQALSIDVSFLALMVVVPAVTLLTLIPFSLNGLGIREGGFVFFLARAGVERSEALSLSLVVYGLTLLFSICGGCIFFFLRSYNPSKGRGIN